MAAIVPDSAPRDKRGERATGPPIRLPKRSHLCYNTRVWPEQAQYAPLEWDICFLGIGQADNESKRGHRMDQASPPIGSSTPLASVMQSRTAALAITGVSAAQIALTLLHLPGWPCPFLQATGIPCPGCGLTRGIHLLLHGNIQDALTVHAYAPVVLVALLLIAAAALLPRPHHAQLVGAVARVERGTRISALLLVGLVVYWAARLLLMPAAFLQLVSAQVLVYGLLI